MGWTYGGWRRESGSAAQRTMLILHIEEVEAKLSEYKSTGAIAQNAARYEYEAYLARLEKQLAAYDDALGLGPDANYPNFVQAKPLTNDSMEINR